MGRLYKLDGVVEPCDCKHAELVHEKIDIGCWGQKEHWGRCSKCGCRKYKSMFSELHQADAIENDMCGL